MVMKLFSIDCVIAKCNLKFYSSICVPRFSIGVMMVETYFSLLPDRLPGKRCVIVCDPKSRLELHISQNVIK